MKPEERDEVMAILMAAWPLPPWSAATVVLWNDKIGPLHAAQSTEAMNNLVENVRRQPTLAQFFEHYRALQPKYLARGHALMRPPCPAGCDEMGRIPSRCDTQTASCECGPEYERNGNVCPLGYNVTRRCPEGCKPRTAAQAEIWLRQQDELVRRERQARREKGLPPLRFDRPLDGIVGNISTLNEEDSF